jgi:tetratricopeptide (TPR) repeat protein
MSYRFEINRDVAVPAGREHLGHGLLTFALRFALACGVVAACASCSPMLVAPPGQIENPIQVLEKSPNIYQVVFRSFADSIETERAEDYLNGNLEYALPPPAKVMAALGDSTKARKLSNRETAQLEYLKARRRYDAGAIQAAAYHLKRAMDADETYRPPYLLLGDMLLDRGAVEQAFDLYKKILTWDPADADALVGIAQCEARVGGIEDARSALVDAVIFNRVNLRAWTDLTNLVSHLGMTVANHDAPDLGLARRVTGRHYDIIVDRSLEDCPGQATAWIAYASERAVWRYEGKYRRHFGPSRYARTYDEDIDCYMVLAAAWKTVCSVEGIRDSTLNVAPDSTTCDASYLDYLGQVADDGYLVSHVLFDHVCIENPGAARYFSVEVLDRLRNYVNTYVIVPKSRS